MFYWSSQFIETFYPYPNEDEYTSEEKRSDPKYSLDVMKYIYSYACKDEYGLRSMYDKWFLNRQYGNANQPIEQYMDIVDPKDPKISTTTNEAGETIYTQNAQEAFRRGYGNIDYKILHVMPKFRSVYIGKMIGSSTDITIKNKDLMTKRQKDLKKNSVWVNKVLLKNSSYREIIEKSKGLEEQYVPGSKEELDLAFTGDKLDYETAMENALRNDYDQSDWDEIEEKLHGSFFDNNRAATRIVIDKGLYQTRIEYQDILKVIKPQSKFNDNRDVPWIGVIDYMNVDQFRAENKNLGEEKIQDLVKTYISEGVINTSHDFNIDAYTEYLETGNCNYNNLKIPYIEAYWKTTDTYGEVEITGKVTKSEIKRGKVYKKGKRYFKQLEDYDSERFVYTAKWLIDSEHVWDYGIMDDQIRKNGDVMFPISYYEQEGDSINERCQRPVDDIILNEYHFQNNQANAPKRQVIIDWDAAEKTAEMIDGMNPFELGKMIKEGGGVTYLKFGTNTDYDDFKSNAGSNIPIYPIEGGMGTQMTEYIQTLATKLQQIQSFTGLQGEQVAEKTKGDDTAYQAQLRASATNESLLMSYRAVNRLKGRCATASAYRIQNLISYSDKFYDSYARIIGVQGCEAIKQLEEEVETPSEWGFDIVSLPTHDDIQDISGWITQGLAGGKNGNASLTLGDAFMVKEMLRNGTSMNEIKRFMQYKDAERDKKEKEFQIKFEKERKAGEADQKKSDHEMRVAEIMAQAKADIMVKRAEAELDAMKIKSESDREKQLEIIKQRFEYMLEMAKMNAESQAESEKKKEDFLSF